MCCHHILLVHGAGIAYSEQNPESAKQRLKHSLIFNVIGIACAIIFLFVYILFVAAMLENAVHDEVALNVTTQAEDASLYVTIGTSL